MTYTAPARWHRTPEPRSMPVGDLTVTYIPDGTVQISPSLLLPDSDPAFWASNAHLLDEQGYLVIGAGGLLVRATDWALLIDTGLGPAPTAPALDGLGPISGGALLRSLSQVGVSPSDLSGVAITHLHADHIGWWSDGRSPFAGLPAYIGSAGWDIGTHAADPSLRPALDALADSVHPLADGATIAPGVSVLPTPGHTPEHTAYVIESRGQTLIAFGDAFHSVAQIAHPHWADGMDHDPAAARSTRAALLHRLAEPDTYGFGVHFADVVFGRVIRTRDGFCWRAAA